MPSAQNCAERLREQAYRTLLPQIRDLEQELQSISNSLSSGVQQIGQKLEALRHIELPTTELVLTEILGDVTRGTELKSTALVQFALAVRQKETQEEILTLLLDSVHRYFNRAALFAVRGNTFVGWSSRGFPDAVARDVGSCSFLRSDCPQFEEVLEGGTPVTVPGLPQGTPLEFLREEEHGAYRLLPLHVMQRPVAVLLAGGAEPAQSDKDALSILAEFAALRLENVALRILYELTAERAEAGVQVKEEQTAASASPIPPPPTPAPEIPKIQFAATQAEAEPVFALPESSSELTAPPAPAPEEIPAAGEEAASFELALKAAAAAPIPEPEPPKEQPQEPRPVPEEEKLHSDARRFARLLVSEIKLYNEHHVVEGRENRDLYLRLKRDIDRSREMYEKRVSPNVSRKIDYFHDEIIRILGDNDPSTLGSDYPGPRVES